jgi:hypothetical protein
MPAAPPLELQAVLGFSGKVPLGLHWHSNGTHIVYPLGSTVVIKSLTDGSQSFLTGHTDPITSVALSPCGRYIASGQRTVYGKKVRDLPFFLLALVWVECLGGQGVKLKAALAHPCSFFKGPCTWPTTRVSFLPLWRV